ncbi:hypothetical protein [Vulcanisaeta souniana]|nr:hypothetical protein [Vulcanisaeta souniana]
MGFQYLFNARTYGRCGSSFLMFCLQAMSEFGVEKVIIVHGSKTISHSLTELFPKPFSDWRKD